MGIFIAYMIKSGFCLLLFYLLYKWQLAKETFFRLNRIMLLGFWILAFLLPAIPLVNWGNTDLPAGLDVNRPEILKQAGNLEFTDEHFSFCGNQYRSSSLHLDLADLYWIYSRCCLDRK